jgi:hypothetical protein
MLTVEIIYSIIAAAVTGSVASLFAPWANWGIEKKRKKLEWRKGFINECKRIINKRDFNISQFRDTFYYSNLKINLSEKLSDRIDYHMGIGVKGKRLSLQKELIIVGKEEKIKRDLLEEISFIEKKWGLL